MKSLIILLSVIALCTVADAQSQTTKNLNIEAGLAIEGYDPVSYFTLNKAVEGKEELSYVHDGVTYRFSKAAHLELFKKNPALYKPMYGGWCAYAMGATGEKVEVDPETFKVVQGKLYLFYNKYFNNTLVKWNKDEPNLMKQADLHWTKITK